MTVKNNSLVGISRVIKEAAETGQKNMTMDDPKIKEPEQLAEPKYSPGRKSTKNIKRINTSAQNRKMVNIRYKDNKGNVTRRSVEPYKIEGEDFWGYDPEKGGIRRFKIDNLKKVKGTDIDFSPKWDIKTAKVGVAGFIEKLSTENY